MMMTEEVLEFLKFCILLISSGAMQLFPTEEILANYDERLQVPEFGHLLLLHWSVMKNFYSEEGRPGVCETLSWFPCLCCNGTFLLKTFSLKIMVRKEVVEFATFFCCTAAMQVFSTEEILPNYGEGGDPAFCEVII
jgi:hypothetical protein